MNGMAIKALAIGGGCFIVAGCITYLCVKHYKKCIKKKRDLLSTVEHFSFSMDEPPDEGGIIRDADDKKHGKNDIPISKYAEGVRNYYEMKNISKNFEEYMAEMESPEDDEDDEDDEIPEEDDDISEKHDGPYRITVAEFCNSRTYYDKISINYFSEDHVFADDKDLVMDNAERILGKDIESIFDGRKMVVYIRNEHLEADYEISFVSGSYKKEILGLE